MSGAGQTPKAPPRPTTEGDVTAYNDLTFDGVVLEVSVNNDGSADFAMKDGEDDEPWLFTMHLRDRVALARQLLEGL